MLMFWIIFFEIAVLYFAGSILLELRGWRRRGSAGLGFALMVAGALMNNVAVLQGDSSVMFTSYAPMQAQPHFYLGLILFAVGALIGCFIFFGTLVIAKERAHLRGLGPAGDLRRAHRRDHRGVHASPRGAIILIPTFLWSLGMVGNIDPLMYRMVWWGARATPSQQINVVGARLGLVPASRR